MLEKDCLTCKKIFSKKKNISKKAWNKQKFCSIQCSGTLIKKGEKLPKYIYNKMLNTYETQHNQKQKGILNNNYKGGVSWGYLKTLALTRDNFTCKTCDHKEPDIMEVDHIKPKSDFPELSKDINNLQTLCPNCHRRKTNRELKEKGHSIRKQYSVFFEKES